MLPDARLRYAAQAEKASCREGVSQFFRCIHRDNASLVRYQLMGLGIAHQLIPDTLPTAPSPLHYGYRTKLTPHFDIPHSRRKRTQSNRDTSDGELNIGFNKQGSRSVIDIEVQ
jgi:hypothetical protein